MTKRTQITIKMETVRDGSPADLSWLEDDSSREAEDRLAEFHRGDWWMVGVRAVAEIRTPYGQGWIVSTMKSPGLWSVESDSSRDYLKAVYEEEKTTLLEMLASLKDFELV